MVIYRILTKVYILMEYRFIADGSVRNLYFNLKGINQSALLCLQENTCLKSTNYYVFEQWTPAEGHLRWMPPVKGNMARKKQGFFFHAELFHTLTFKLSRNRCWSVFKSEGIINHFISRLICLFMLTCVTYMIFFMTYDCLVLTAFR